MIYRLPATEDAVDQGDIIDDCPILQIAHFDPERPALPKVACSLARIVILTQTCDLANQKTQRISVAVVHNVRFLVDRKIVKVADVRGPIRAVGFSAGTSCLAAWSWGLKNLSLTCANCLLCRWK